MDKLKHLYFNGALSVGITLNVPKELSRRLSRVLRQKKGHYIALFNGKDGLFEGEIKDDKCTEIYIKSILKPQGDALKSTLFIAVVKKEAMDKIFRQATEFGITEIVPLITDHTLVDKLNEERIHTLLIEASEQYERLTIPKLRPLSHMEQVIKEFSSTIFWCAEQVGGQWGNHESTVSGDAILVGPEGGFSSRERLWLNECLNVTPVGLGHHILRSDTAVCAALSRFFDHF